MFSIFGINSLFVFTETPKLEKGESTTTLKNVKYKHVLALVNPFLPTIYLVHISRWGWGHWQDGGGFTLLLNPIKTDPK